MDSNELVGLVGFDWADEKHVVCIHDGSSYQRDEVAHSPEAVLAWVLELRKQFPSGRIGVAIDQSKGAVVNILARFDFLVLYFINPKSIARAREVFRGSGAKDDPDDAWLLMELIRVHREKFRAYEPDSEPMRKLSALVETRRKLVDQRKRLINQIQSTLKVFFPQALELAGKVGSTLFNAFLLKWPTLKTLQRAKAETVRRFYRSHAVRKSELIEKRVSMIPSMVSLTDDEIVLIPSTLLVKTFVQQIEILSESITQLDRQIAVLFESLDDFRLFNSFPGAGSALAPRLAAAMGSRRDRYQSAKQIQEFSGIAPVTVSSGKSRFVHRRYACPKFMLQTFHEFAWQSTFQCSWAKSVYTTMRARGIRHHAAIRALSFKWIRIIFKCWQDRTLYNENLYIASLQKRRVAISI